jgi:hypothetical protein
LKDGVVLIGKDDNKKYIVKAKDIAVKECAAPKSVTIFKTNIIRKNWKKKLLYQYEATVLVMIYLTQLLKILQSIFIKRLEN